jgi:hypothetical protein
MPVCFEAISAAEVSKNADISAQIDVRLSGLSLLELTKDKEAI